MRIRSKPASSWARAKRRGVDRVDGRAGARPALGGVAGADHAEDLDLAAVLLGGGVLLGEGAGHRVPFVGRPSQAGTETVPAPARRRGRGDEAAVAVGVGQRLEPADQQRADAEVHVVEQRRRRPARSCRPAPWSCRSRRSPWRSRSTGACRGRRPAAAYSSSRCEPTAFLLSSPKRPVGSAVPALLLVSVEDRLGAGPGLLLGVGHDRPEADAEPWCRGRTAPRPPGPGAIRSRMPVERLAPERVDVGVLAADPDGVLGRAAEVHGDRRSPGGPTTSAPFTR